MDKYDEEDILNVEFDPSELDNIDEDALLNETFSEACPTKEVVPLSSPQLLSVIPESTAESAVTSSVEIKEVVAASAVEPESSQTDQSLTENQISSTKSDDVGESKSDEVDQSSHNKNNHSEDEEEEKSSTRDKFKTEDAQVKPRKYAVSRDNIPESLSDVKLPEQPVKCYTGRDSQRFYSSRYKKDYRTKSGTVERVFVNPHFKGSLRLDETSTKMTWTSQGGSKPSQPVLLSSTSLMRPAPTTLIPSVAATPSLLAMPPPPFPLIPVVVRPGLINAPQPVSLVQPTITKPLFDTSRPPPPLLNVGPIPEKADWLGATEDFLKKLQSKDSHSPGRSYSNRHAADSIRRKYGVSNSRIESRRRSSASSTKNHEEDTKKLAEKVEESILAKHGDICDANYLKMMAQQKLMRETLLKRKELRRQMEISSKKQSPSADRTTAAKSMEKTCDAEPVGQALKSNSVKDRITLSAKKPLTLESKRIGQKVSTDAVGKAPRVDVGPAPKPAQAVSSTRRVVLPPGAAKTSLKTSAALKQKIDNDRVGPTERKILRLNLNPDLDRDKSAALIAKTLGDSRRITLWTTANKCGK